MLTMKTIMSQVQEGDWFVTICLNGAYFHIQVVQRHRIILGFAIWREGLPIQGPALWPGFGAENVSEMHGGCTGPFEAPGHSCTELSGRLAHSGSLQGASESSQGYRSWPHTFSWPQDERQEECAPPISAKRVSRGSFGFRSDAGPFGSCPDTRSYSMSGPLQARPSCLCRLLGLMAAASPENGCDPPSPYDHEGCINDRLGRGLRRQTGEWKEEFLSWHINCLELRAVFLALKYFLPVLGGGGIIS